MASYVHLVLSTLLITSTLVLFLISVREIEWEVDVIFIFRDEHQQIRVWLVLRKDVTRGRERCSLVDRKERIHGRRA